MFIIHILFHRVIQEVIKKTKTHLYRENNLNNNIHFLLGPLLVQLPNKRWITVGIVSYGIRCGEVNHPGVYTRVNSYSSWIIENALF